MFNIDLFLGIVFALPFTAATMLWLYWNFQILFSCFCHVIGSLRIICTLLKGQICSSQWLIHIDGERLGLWINGFSTFLAGDQTLNLTTEENANKHGCSHLEYTSQPSVIIYFPIVANTLIVPLAIWAQCKLSSRCMKSCSSTFLLKDDRKCCLHTILPVSYQVNTISRMLTNLSSSMSTSVLNCPW